jgi:hypothetical protein
MVNLTPSSGAWRRGGERVVGRGNGIGNRSVCQIWRVDTPYPLYYQINSYQNTNKAKPLKSRDCKAENSI